MRSIHTALVAAALAGAAAAQEDPASQDPASEDPVPVAERLPADTVLHVVLPDWGTWVEAMEGSDLLEFVRDEQTREFLQPFLDRIERDLRFLLREDEELLPYALDPDLGVVTFSLLELEFPEEDGDEPDVELVATAHLPGRATEFHELLQALALEKDEDLRVWEVAGRPAFDPPGTEDVAMSVARDGETLLWTVGEGVLEDHLAREEGGLAGSETYRAVRAELGTGPASTFVYLDGQAMTEIYGELMALQLAMFVTEGEDREKLRRIHTEDPKLEPIEALGWSLSPADEGLVDRVYLRATGDKSAWGVPGDLGDVPARHARYLPAGTDLLYSSWADWENQLELARKESERVQGLLEDVESEMAKDLLEGLGTFDVGKLLDRFAEETGVDVTGELLPAVGHGLSVGIALPEGNAIAVPEVVVVVDVSDREALAGVLEKLVAKAEDVPEIAVKASEHEGYQLHEVQLLNAGLPVVPTACVAGDVLLLALTPQSARERLTAVEGEDNLAESGRLFLPSPPEEGHLTAALWMDLGQTYDFFYGLVGFALSAARMQGAELSEELDPSLLPSGEEVDAWLSAGTMTVVNREDGMLIEGRSALGNPLTGFFAGSLGLVGVVGIAELVGDGADSERRRVSAEHLDELADAMAAYRSSVGGGSYPDSLLELLDRGILYDRDVLVDPADSDPRNLRSGTGERIPVSYAIARRESLPEAVRDELRTTDSEVVLYTREAWHETWMGAVYLVRGLEESDQVEEVEEDDWR